MWEQPSFERQQEVLNSPFDINTHKETFVSYLEVIIDENGEIFYAVPSHTHKLCEIYMNRFGVDNYEKRKKKSLKLHGVYHSICANIFVQRPDVSQYGSKDIEESQIRHSLTN